MCVCVRERERETERPGREEIKTRRWKEREWWKQVQKSKRNL